ncbi:hypothetical protein [Synechococcus sp. LA31]|jgi:hypothetical protein|uniref:hypothetical protein n=1 Tax=Synechococcus sp. LA31 TaxID=2741953 RepID=UPI001BDCAE1B|nr:hypothetical protein [Synechococcus sp. LA31]QVV68269.1 hypothetical protein KJJ24_03630 [Synechococcus sp. LA31]
MPLAGALFLALSPAVRAGSITAESIWDKKSAIERAEAQMPANATVTNTKCTVVNVHIGNYRYICTVEYTTAPSGTTPSSESSAPAP